MKLTTLFAVLLGFAGPHLATAASLEWEFGTAEISNPIKIPTKDGSAWFHRRDKDTNVRKGEAPTVGADTGSLAFEEEVGGLVADIILPSQPSKIEVSFAFLPGNGSDPSQKILTYANAWALVYNGAKKTLSWILWDSQTKYAEAKLPCPDNKWVAIKATFESGTATMEIDGTKKSVEFQPPFRDDNQKPDLRMAYIKDHPASFAIADLKIKAE